MMLDLYEFKRHHALRGKDVVNWLSRFYPKFTKAAESLVRHSDERGLWLSPEAEALLRQKFDAAGKRTRSSSSGGSGSDRRRIVKCRIRPELADAFTELARSMGYTVQELLSDYIKEWYTANKAAKETITE